VRYFLDAVIHNCNFSPHPPPFERDPPSSPYLFAKSCSSVNLFTVFRIATRITASNTVVLSVIRENL
jgi:hypothetical protein